MIIKFLLKTLGNLFTFLGMIIVMFTYTPIVYSEIGYFINNDVYSENDLVTNGNRSIDTKTDSENIISLKPVNYNFSIMINKIGVNAPIVKEVSTINKTEYMNSLRFGVAHAKGTPLPGENGNIFLFAHSSLNFWELGKYATVFNLLNHVKNGDSVILYYEGKPYAYEVFDIQIVNGWNTAPFDTSYQEPIVTLVTCYPAGSTKNRLVVKAKRL